MSLYRKANYILWMVQYNHEHFISSMDLQKVRFHAAATVP